MSDLVKIITLKGVLLLFLLLFSCWSGWVGFSFFLLWVGGWVGGGVLVYI